MFHTITDADWARELKRARGVRNDIVEQIKAMLKYVKFETGGGIPDAYEVFTPFTGLFIGRIMQDEGFYYFFPEYAQKGAMWAGAMLNDLAHKLQALNESETQRQLKEAIEPAPDCTD